MGRFEAAMARLASVPEQELARSLARREPGSIQFALYGGLREEQAALVRAQAAGRPTEVDRILALAQQAFGDLRGLLLGRPENVTDRRPAESEWNLRELLRHAIAVELRYAAQVLYSAHRSDHEPIAIPTERLPCDRLTPPEPAYAETRTAGLDRLLERLASARAQTDGLLSAVPESALGRPSLWGTVEIDVRRRLHQIAAHLVEHTVQCEKILFAIGEVDSEPRRVVRRISATRGAHEGVSDEATLRELDARHAERASSL